MDIDWTDPNLLIGGENLTSNEIEILSKINLTKKETTNYIEKRLRQAHDYLWITHFSGLKDIVNYIVIKEQSKTPVSILKTYNEKRKFTWVLDKNPEKWEFVPDSLFYTPDENPNSWRMEEFIREMNFWGLALNPEKNDPINGHYTGLCLWHIFDGIIPGNNKDKMREVLHCTNLIELKPYYDFSIAKRIFAKNIYPFSELAQRAADENLLWFCMEYSEYLNALPGERKESKDNIRTKTTEVIKNYRNALSAGKKGIEYPTLPTIALLQKEGADWRLWIKDLILSDAIRLCWEGIGETENIEYQCRQYLSAWSRHNGIAGHRKGHKPIPPQEKGKSSCRGRPPKKGG